MQDDGSRSGRARAPTNARDVFETRSIIYKTDHGLTALKDEESLTHTRLQPRCTCAGSFPHMGTKRRQEQLRRGVDDVLGPAKRAVGRSVRSPQGGDPNSHLRRTDLLHTVSQTARLRILGPLSHQTIGQPLSK